MPNLFRKLFCPQSVYERRLATSAFWANKLDYVVQYGPLKGFRLSDNPVWSSGDLAPKLFGLYEQQVMSVLRQFSATKRILIDCGAADGYYAVGAVARGIFDRCIAYEMDERARDLLSNLAITNGIGDAVEVNGAVDSQTLLRLDSATLEGAVLLVDIEGGEFDLLTHSVIDKLCLTHCIIELHPWASDDGSSKVENLKSMFSESHAVRSIGFGPRDLSVFPELARVNDDDRWLIASEGRGRGMEWLVCVPNGSIH